MGGHTDHYEEELSQPLISFSFGQSAVFLIGGCTRDIKPEGIYSLICNHYLMVYL